MDLVKKKPNIKCYALPGWSMLLFLFFGDNLIPNLHDSVCNDI